MRRCATGAAVAAGVGLGVCALPLWAQSEDDAPRGFVIELDLSSTLRWADNQGLDDPSLGSTTRWQTGFDVNVLSETRNQRIELGFSGALRAEDGPSSDDGQGVQNPRLRFGYTLDGPRAGLTLSAAYSRAEVDGFSTTFDSALGTTTLISDIGDRDSYRYSAQLELGKESPIGVVFSLNQNGTQYRDTVNTRLFDSETTRGSVALSFRLTPTTTGSVLASTSHYTAEDSTNTERDRHALTFGLTHELARGLEIEAQIGQVEIDDSVDGKSESGTGLLRVTQDMTNGEAWAGFEREFTTAGRIDSLTVSRSLEFPTWTLDAELGLTKALDEDVEPTYSLTYQREFKRAALSASVSRSISVNDSAQVQSVLAAQVDYAQGLNERMSLDFGLSYTDIEAVGSSGLTPSKRSSVTAGLTHSLTEDWSLSAGYERRFLDDAGTTATDNAVFVTLGRSFTFLP